MDTTDPEISFDPDGRCSHCTEALERIRRQLLPPAERAAALERLVKAVRRNGSGKDYDCIIGVSGGVDSTATAVIVKRDLGLRPLAVHFDNGWDSELAVANIKLVLDKLDIELYTYVVDWEEFRDIQLSFLRASIPDAELPTDHGINALLPRIAKEQGLRYIISGSNVATEAVMPYSWGHYNHDLRHLQAIQRRFGSRKIRSLPTISLANYMEYFVARKMRQIPILNYVEYRRDEWIERLKNELGWRDYGAKHYESVWTRFFQGYYLPTKFGFDKRRAHYSSLICSGEMTRDRALELMKEPLYDPELLRTDTDYVLKKFGLSPAEWERIMRAEPRKAREFPSHYFLFHRMRRYKNMFRSYATSI